MNKIIIASFMLTTMFSVSFVLTASAGWVYEGSESWKWKYVKEDGSIPVSTWEEIGGKKYHFDDEGYLDVGWRQFGQDWFYLDDESGAMSINGKTDTGYIDTDGSFKTNYPNKGIQNNSEEANAYWDTKIKEYGYGDIQPQHITAGDGTGYYAYVFPINSGSAFDRSMGQRCYVDFYEVSNAYIS